MRRINQVESYYKRNGIGKDKKEGVTRGRCMRREESIYFSRFFSFQPFNLSLIAFS
jgi:hypothetical protein